jgi:hypothetical protein
VVWESLAGTAVLGIPLPEPTERPGSPPVPPVIIRIYNGSLSLALTKCAHLGTPNCLARLVPCRNETFQKLQRSSQQVHPGIGCGVRKSAVGISPRTPEPITTPLELGSGSEGKGFIHDASFWRSAKV